MDTIIVFIAQYLYLIVLFIATIFFFLQPRKIKKGVLICGIIVAPLAYAISRIASALYYNPRPFVVGHFTPLIAHAADNGFPSDHMLLAGAMAMIVWFYNKKLGATLWMIAFLIGWARVYGGIHHVVDIVGSVIIVLVSGLAYYLAVRRANAHRKTGRLLYHFLIASAIIVASGFILAKGNYSISSPVAPMPTVIDPNFTTQVNDCFIPTAAANGYSLRIVSGFRSLAEQQQIYDQGRLENGAVVSESPPGHSLHNYGFAVDVADKWKGYNINWSELIAIGTYCGLDNGGVGDYPHFEYRGGFTTDQFMAGMRPKPLTLPCPIMAE